MSERAMVLVGGRRLYLTDHAITRYHERVRPALSRRDVLAELLRVLPGCPIVPDRPVWAVGWDGAGPWLIIGDGVAMPINAGRLVSCAYRAEVGARPRVVKQELRQRKHARGKREKHGKVAREERRRRRDAA